MPQFDVSHYASQLFWLLICFGSALLYTLFYSLPRLRQVLEERWQKTAGYHLETDKIKIQFDTMTHQIESDLTKARKNALALMSTALKDEKQNLSAQKALLTAEFKEKLSQATKEVNTSKDLSLHDIAPYTREITGEILKRILPTAIPEGSIDSAMTYHSTRKQANHV